MKKVLKVIVILIGLVVAAGAGLGFAAKPGFASRTEVLVDAPVGKVWDVISDPKRAGEWLPKQSGGGGIAEVREAGEKRHTYVQADGKHLTCEVVERDKKKRYMERVVETDTALPYLFAEIVWGFELREAEGGKTWLAVLDGGTATRPLGVVALKVSEVTGAKRRAMEEIARNVEAVAKGRKP